MGTASCVQLGEGGGVAVWTVRRSLVLCALRHLRSLRPLGVSYVAERCVIVRAEVQRRGVSLPLSVRLPGVPPVASSSVLNPKRAVPCRAAFSA